MKQLMSVNDGFNSRIDSIVEFPDYTVDELIQILELMGKKKNLVLEPDFINESRKVFEKWLESKTSSFGNARDVRKFLNQADGNRANRISELVDSGKEVVDELINHFRAIRCVQ